jgi:hypothetical protein
MTFKTVGSAPCLGRRLSLFDRIISLFAELGIFCRKCLIRRYVELAFQPRRGAFGDIAVFGVAGNLPRARL